MKILLTSAAFGIVFYLLMATSQSDACLDLLLRSLNEIFTPVIETSENRVHKPHRVDDLTRLYKQDENGNFVLRDDKWLDANPFVKSPKFRGIYKPEPRSLFDHLNSAARSNPEEEEDVEFAWVKDSEESDSEPMRFLNASNYELSANRSNTSTSEGFVGFERSALNDGDEDNNTRTPHARKVQIANQDNEYEEDYPAIDDDPFPDEHRSRYYVPGDRPLVDLLIKILELFQVGLEATPNYIVPPSKKKGTKSKIKIKFRSVNESSSRDE